MGAPGGRPQGLASEGCLGGREGEMENSADPETSYLGA